MYWIFLFLTNTYVTWNDIFKSHSLLFSTLIILGHPEVEMPTAQRPGDLQRYKYCMRERGEVELIENLGLLRYLHSHGRKGGGCGGAGWRGHVAGVGGAVTLLNDTLPGERSSVLRSEGAKTPKHLLLGSFPSAFRLPYKIISSSLQMKSVVITSSPQAANKPFAWNRESCLLPQWTKLEENTKNRKSK